MIEYNKLNGRKIQIDQDEEGSPVQVSINGDSVDSLHDLTELMVEIVQQLNSVDYGEVQGFDQISAELEEASVVMSQLSKKCSLMVENGEF